MLSIGSIALHCSNNRLLPIVLLVEACSFSPYFKFIGIFSVFFIQVGCCFFAPPLIPFILRFSGDYERKNEKGENEDLSNPHEVSGEDEARVVANYADEEMNVGSATSFKDYDGAESVELHNYEPDDVDPIHRK